MTHSDTAEAGEKEYRSSKKDYIALWSFLIWLIVALVQFVNFAGGARVPESCLRMLNLFSFYVLVAGYITGLFMYFRSNFLL